MEKIKKWKKYIIYFIVGYIIFLTFYSISQIQFLQNVINIDVNLTQIIFQMMKQTIVLYTLIFFLILMINILYNVKLAKQLNMNTEKLRKVNKEEILNERRAINMKKKILIYILVLIIIALLIFSIDLVRKVIILDKYNEATEQHLKEDNYYAKIIYGNGGNTVEEFGKGDIQIYRSTSPDGMVTHTIYKDGEKTLLLNETKDEKIALEGEYRVSRFSGGDAYFSEEMNLLDKIKLALETKITSENVNGTECYKLYLEDSLQTYISKKDFVAIKWVNGYISGQPIEFNEVVEHSFGTVTDEDLIIEDLEEYTTIKK